VCLYTRLPGVNDVGHLQLLGSDSHDIDIALENMTGHAFALQFTEFASKLKDLPVKSVAVVKGNPGQSKHLETAKTTVLGLDLDFVNLRDEAYADDSRIPTNVVSYWRNTPLFVYLKQIKTFGTPLQDALRRDTTINSLFYNVHTRSVEDHCGKVALFSAYRNTGSMIVSGPR
jgi:tRNA nucleotidyltransferase (CCA-adding enzyme)